MSYHDEYARRRHFELSYHEGYHVESGFEWYNPKSGKIDCMSDDSPYFSSIVAMRKAVYYQLKRGNHREGISVFEYRKRFAVNTGYPRYYDAPNKAGARYVGHAWVGGDSILWMNAEGKRYTLNPDGTIKNVPKPPRLY